MNSNRSHFIQDVHIHRQFGGINVTATSHIEKINVILHIHRRYRAFNKTELT